MTLTPFQLGQLRKSPAECRIRTARKLAKLTQVQVAAGVGLTQAALSDIERKRWGSTSTDTAHKFAAFFGCAIEDLFPAKDKEAVAS